MLQQEIGKDEKGNRALLLVAQLSRAISGRKGLI